MFPNAASGVKKIYIGTIIAIAGVAAAGLATVIVYAFAGGMTVGIEGAFLNAFTASPLLALSSFLGTVGGLAAIAAWVLQLIGILQATKDEENFKTVLYLIIAGIAVGFIGTIFSANAFFAQLFQIAADVISLMTTIMIINSINNLAEQLRNTEIQERGNNVIRLVVITLGLSILARFLLMVLGGVFFNALALLLALAMIVLHVVQLIIYIMYLNQANHLLND